MFDGEIVGKNGFADGFFDKITDGIDVGLVDEGPIVGSAGSLLV